ncbi:MAG: carbohydrate kinase family protein [Bacteroidia bacterium]
MKIDVLAIGELLADLISTDYVQDISEVKQFEIYQGGSPANLCANLKWLGRNAELVACIGDDSVGKMLTQNLAKVGIGSDKIEICDQYPSSLVLVGKSKNSPDFIAYRMADSQIPKIDTNWLKESRIVHTSAFALSKEPARTNILNALKSASALGKQVSCDWNFAQKIWQNDSGIHVFEELCGLNPLLKLSLDDIQRFLNVEDANVETAKEFLSLFKTQITCLTCGSEGVWYSEKNGEWFHLDANLVKEVKDTTGAGDAFWAGFLNAKLEGLNAELCVKEGLQLASKKVQIVGPIYLKQPLEKVYS